MMPLQETVQNIDFTTARDRTYPTTEDSAERSYVRLQHSGPDPVSYEHLGRAEGFDEDGIGDIADEGRGHRG